MINYLFVIQKESYPKKVYITGYDILNRVVYEKVISGESAELFGGDLDDIERFVEDNVLRRVLSKGERCIYINALGDDVVEDEGSVYVLVKTDYLNL